MSSQYLFSQMDRFYIPDFSLLPLSGAVAGIVDQPMQNFQKNWETQSSAGSKAKGMISGVGKGIVGVFTKPIGGAAELVSQTGYGEDGRLHSIAMSLTLTY